MSTDQLVPLYGLYGPLYFATIMTTAFYGVTCMQTFFYYVHYQSDPLRRKILVAGLWALNTIHEGLTVAGTYKSIKADLTNPFLLLNGTSELILQTLLMVLVAVVTQGFFVRRIYLFSDKNIIAPLIWVVLAIAQLASTTGYVVKALYSTNGVRFVPLSVLSKDPFMALATSCLSVAAGVDILIAVFLTFLLVRKRTAAEYSSTAHVLHRLAVFAVNTGVWPATFALVSVVLLHVFPTSMIYAAFVVPLCSVYCNTVFANLNARAYVRGDSMYNVDMDAFGTVSGLRRNTKVGRRGEDGVRLAQQGIWKTTEVVTFTDAKADV